MPGSMRGVQDSRLPMVRAAAWLAVVETDSMEETQVVREVAVLEENMSLLVDIMTDVVAELRGSDEVDEVVNEGGDGLCVGGHSLASAASGFSSSWKGRIRACDLGRGG